MKYLFALFFLFSTIYSFAKKEVDTIQYVTIEQALKMDVESVTAIDLSKRKLTVLPKELKQFTYLRHLNLSKNKLTEIPEFLSTFVHLIDLNLSKNSFTVFPSEICKMKSLIRLGVSQNPFSHISECIVNLDNLKYIDLFETPLETFPNAFLTMKNLKNIDMQGIVYGPTYQQKWIRGLHWVKIAFDAPCDCMEK